MIRTINGKTASYRVCLRCGGTGLIWLSNQVGCSAAFRCPVCPDDGTGNSRGTGWVEDAAVFS